MTDLTLSQPIRAGARAMPRSGWILGGVAALQIALWTVLPPLVSTSPPLDVTEGYLWGREWPLVTYKHPQLPAWLLEIGHRLTGSYIWPHYLIAQLFIVAAFVFVYRFGRDIMGAKAGLAGALLMTSLYYYEWVAQQFNHDTAQIPFWAAIVFALWRAVERDQWKYWLLLGAVAGIGLYAKFSTGVIIGFGGVWLLADPQARARMTSPKPWLAFALFLVIAAPLALALHADDLLPFRYAAERADWVTDHRSIVYFIGVQLAAHIGLLVVILATGLLPLRFRRAPAATGDTSPAIVIGPRALAYLTWMALGPGTVISVASLFVGVGEAWATPMFNLSGLVAVVLFRQYFDDKVLRRITIAAPIMVALWAIAYCGLVIHVHEAGRRLAPVLIPQAAMSARLDAIWQSALHRPLTIIGGIEDPEPMAAALSVLGEPSFFTDFSTVEAPWVTPARIAREGMLVIWSHEEDPPDEALPFLAQATTRGVEHFPWSMAKDAKPVVLNYAIVPPRE